MFERHHLPLLLALCFVPCLLAGCNGSPAPTTKSKDTPATTTSPGSKSPDTPVADSKPKWVGKWRVELVEEGIAREFSLIEITPGTAEGSYAINSIVLSPDYDAARLTDGAIQGNEIKLKYQASEDLIYNFRGKISDQGVNGTVVIPKLSAGPMRLVKTESETLENKSDGTPLEGHDLFQKAAESADGIDALRDFIQSYPTNPVILHAYDALLIHYKNHEFKPEEVAKLHDECLKTAELWGQEVQLRALLEQALTLSRIDYCPDLAKKYLDEFEKQWHAELPQPWQFDLAQGRVNLKDPEAAIKILKPILEKRPQEPIATFVYARAMEAQQKPDEAMQYFAKLAALPMLERVLSSLLPEARQESPSNAAQRLWKEKHKNLDGFNTYLTEVFVRETAKLIPPRTDIPPRPKNAKVMLLELFTGTSCPPCVAADIAFSGIHLHYKPEEVVILKFHQHIPGPDPFASETTRKRFQYYPLEGTPMGALDGKVKEDLPGSTMHATPRYLGLTGDLDAGLQRTTPVEIELRGQLQQETITIDVEAKGEKFSKDTRLRLALIENGVEFPAPNGIRMHDCIVRYMPGGAEGIAPQDQRLTYKGSISLKQIRTELEKDTATIEERMGQLFARPAELKHLQLVAFVQDDSTKEVLQAKLIDLTPPAHPPAAK